MLPILIITALLWSLMRGVDAAIGQLTDTPRCWRNDGPEGRS